MAANKEELHRMIDKTEDSADLRLTFDAIHSIVERHQDEFDDLDMWQREEIRKALKQADEGDFATPEEAKQFTEKWFYGS